MLNYVYFTLDSHDVLIPALIYRASQPTPGTVGAVAVPFDPPTKNEPPPNNNPAPIRLRQLRPPGPSRLPPVATAKHPSSPSLPPPPPTPPTVITEGRLWTAEPRRRHDNFISDPVLGQDDSEAKAASSPLGRGPVNQCRRRPGRSGMQSRYYYRKVLK